MQNDLDVIAIRAAFNWSRADLAEVARVDVATVWRWETNGVPKRGTARAFLERLAEDAKRAALGGIQ